MDEFAVAVCGTWCRGPQGMWEFSVDDNLLSRIIDLRQTETLVQLEDVVLKEFGLQVQPRPTVKLSYLPKSTSERFFPANTPPVVLGSDAALAFYKKMYSLDPDVALCVNFLQEKSFMKRNMPLGDQFGFMTPQSVRNKKSATDFCCGSSASFVKGSGSVTPNQTAKRKSSFDGGFYTGNGKNESGFVTPQSGVRSSSVNVSGAGVSVNLAKDSSLFTPGPSAKMSNVENGINGDFSGSSVFETGFVTPVQSTKRSSQVDLGGGRKAASGGLSDIDEEELLNHVKKTESELKRKRDSHGNLTPEFTDAFIDIDSDGNETEEIVSLRNYNDEFWDSFIDVGDGGSEAVEVMCTTNDAFHHRVVFGADPVTYNKEQENKPPASVHGESSGGQQSSGQADAGQRSGFQGSGFHRANNQASHNTGGHSGTQERRKVSEIDDEEFDIPPLYDDTEYVRHDEIPDLDRVFDDDELRKGKLYHSKKDCQIALAIYAIKNQFKFRQTRTDKKYFVLSCTDPKCDWRIMAHICKNSTQYNLRKLQLVHSCPIESRQDFKKRATSRVIAHLYKTRFGNSYSSPRSMDLQQMILEDLQIKIPYMKCWRAREQAIASVRGTDEDSYLKLSQYLYMLKKENPGTVTDLLTMNDDDGAERFLYMFLAFGASIQGFRHLRRVLIMDGTHLYGKFKGVLLTASGQDANFQVFPLAFAIVDSENDDSWTWFMQNVERIVSDSKQLTLITDRCKSIYNAKAKVFPLANHGACLVHLQRNVVARYRNQGLSKVVGQAARAYRLGTFNQYYSEIRNINSDCCSYLENIGLEHWTRFYCKGNMYNLMTSNIAETLNNALRSGRSSPIVELLMFIQALMTRWFNARRKKSGRCHGTVSLEADKVMTKNKLKTKAKGIQLIDGWSGVVVGSFNEKNTALLREKQCSCRRYDRELIPCGHALLVADTLNLDNGTLCADFYKTTTWRATYEGVIKPAGDSTDCDIPPEELLPELLPPIGRRPAGRPKETRTPSTGEFQKQNGKIGVNRCGKCKQIGHNRATCTNPLI